MSRKKKDLPGAILARVHTTSVVEGIRIADQFGDSLIIFSSHLPEVADVLARFIEEPGEPLSHTTMSGLWTINLRSYGGRLSLVDIDDGDTIVLDVSQVKLLKDFIDQLVE